MRACGRELGEEGKRLCGLGLHAITAKGCAKSSLGSSPWVGSPEADLTHLPRSQFPSSITRSLGVVDTCPSLLDIDALSMYNPPNDATIFFSKSH